MKIILTLEEILTKINILGKTENRPIVIDLLHWNLLRNKILPQTFPLPEKGAF